MRQREAGPDRAWQAWFMGRQLLILGRLSARICQVCTLGGCVNKARNADAQELKANGVVSATFWA